MKRNVSQSYKKYYVSLNDKNSMLQCLTAFDNSSPLSGLSSQKSHKNDGVKLSPCSALRCSCKGEQTAALTGHQGQATFHICSSPEISKTIRPPSGSQSPVLTMHSTLPAPRMSRRTYALPYNKVRSSDDNTTPCRLVYKYAHPGESCFMHSRAIYLGTTPRMSIYR